jgi:uncharacterized protein YecE (DUF72 family)
LFGHRCGYVRDVIHIGTSGWQYRDWRGRFYPGALAQRGWPEHYTTRFDTVEVNSSFYRLPERTTFERWRDQVPSGFVMAVKASRFLTHLKRLEAPREPVDRLLERASALGPALGPLLVQLPPTLPLDLDRLRALLDAIDGRVPTALEFRHPSWFVDETYDVLDRAGAALVLADRPGSRQAPVVTGGWSYVRFHQGTRVGARYRRSKLARWADRVATLPARDVYVYFNNDPAAAAPRDAATLRELVRARGSSVARPAA